MSRLRRHPALLLWLTLVWVGLWGSVTAANVLGGLAVAAVLLRLLPPADDPAGRGDRISPWGVLSFLGLFAVELVKASGIVVWQVLRPRGHLHQAVIAVPAPGSSDLLLTLVANAVSLTPGTLTLEVDRERSVLYVHVLDVAGPEGLDSARRGVERLHRAAVRATGSPQQRARLSAGEVGA